jgi:hypothetical protein
MTLGFMTKWANGEPTYFVEKIWAGLREHEISTRSEELFYSENANKFLYSSGFQPKIHTIREDKSNRWREGNNIHFVINNRQPNRFQFAPVIECTGVQHIMISSDIKVVWINGEIIIDNEILKQLAINDGFKSVSDFFDYFPDGFQGRIIHWTNKRY